jgi:hypothetical protein
MYILSDTFNKVEISRHRTARNAVKAQYRHLAAVKKANGPNSYLTYSIKHSSGRDVWDEVDSEKVKIAFDIR